MMMYCGNEYVWFYVYNHLCVALVGMLTKINPNCPLHACKTSTLRAAPSVEIQLILELGRRAFLIAEPTLWY